MKKYLLTPGPTPVPEDTRLAEAQPIIHHRTKEFLEIFERISEDLKIVFKTKNPVLTFLSSGTGAMEGAVANTLSPGDKALCIKGVNTPAAASISVAELVLAHMFALSRNIVRGTTGVREGKWEKGTLAGVELYGKTLGIMGLGRIGKELAKRARALGMKVIGYDPYAQLEDMGMVTLDDLLRNSDYISIHTPLTEETRHLIGAKEFSKMKPSAILINCARGGIVDEDALLEALKSSKIAGAGLDVFEAEPPKISELMALSNVTFTPHLGASTKEAQDRIGDEVVKIISEAITPP